MLEVWLIDGFVECILLGFVIIVFLVIVFLGLYNFLVLMNILYELNVDLFIKRIGFVLILFKVRV